MKVVEMKITDIKPYENNPRNNENAVEKVAASIQEFGFNQPIVVDDNHVIVVGHTRYQAAIALGLDKVPVYVLSGKTEEQYKAYRLADNKTNEFADWDWDRLSEELESIEGLDMGLFGFEPNFTIDELADELNAWDSKEDMEHFALTLLIPNEKKDIVSAYISKKGRQALIDLVVNECESLNGNAEEEGEEGGMIEL